MRQGSAESSRSPGCRLPSSSPSREAIYWTLLFVDDCFAGWKSLIGLSERLSEDLLGSVSLREGDPLGRKTDRDVTGRDPLGQPSGRTRRSPDLKNPHPPAEWHRRTPRSSRIVVDTPREDSAGRV